MGDPYEYYAVGAPRPRTCPVIALLSSQIFTKNLAAVCVAIALVIASMVHIAVVLPGAFAAMVVLVAGAWLRGYLQAERASDKKALVDAGHLVTSREVEQCDKKDRKFVEKARSAVAVITSSKAFADGWLGDVDFTPDLFWIASSAVQASAMQELIDKLKPSRRVADKQAVIGGKQWLDARRTRLDERVKLLEDAAKQALSVDTRLIRQQETAARLALRDEEAARMAALRTRLIGTQARRPLLDPGPEGVEAIAARAEAFHDVDAIGRRVMGDPVASGGGVVGWVRRLVRL